jgi:iron(III) transport system substrate-binding protein
LRRVARIFFLPLIAAAAIFPLGCGGDEGTLTIYSGRTSSLVQPLLEEFSRDTGIKIRVRYGDSAELAATILEEGGNSPADVFFSQDAGALGALVERGRLQTLPADLLNKVPEQFRSPAGFWVGISGRSRTLTYNTDKVHESDLPASIMELTDPKWRGRLAWAPSNASFQSFVTGMRLLRGEVATRDWLRAMKANGVRDYPNNVAIVQAVGAGEVDVGLVNHYYLYQFLAEQGTSFKARNYYLKGGDPGALINSAGAGILKDAGNVADAQRFIEYVLSEPAQEYFAETTYEYPLVPGIAVSFELPWLATLQPPNVDLSDLSDLSGTLTLLRETGVLP